MRLLTSFVNNSKHNNQHLFYYMIEKLTKEQESRMSVYAEKWVNTGISTARINPARAKEIINAYQREVLQAKETPVIITNNPIEGWVAVVLLTEGTAIDKVQDEMEAVFQNKETLDTLLKNNPPVYPYQDGSFYSSIISFYDFMINELGVEIEDDLMKRYQAWSDTTELGLVFPLDEVAVVTEKPLTLNFNEEGQLHADGKPAMMYAGMGEFEVYSLNGVRVPKWLAMADEGSLDLSQYSKIENADVRTEFVRKFGVERMMESYGKKLDTFENYNEKWWTKSEYELWDMNAIFEGVSYAPHLKMKNATTGVWHVEAVHPSCQTLEDAIRDRFGGRDFRIAAIA